MPVWTRYCRCSSTSENARPWSAVPSPNVRITTSTPRPPDATLVKIHGVKPTTNPAATVGQRRAGSMPPATPIATQMTKNTTAS